MRPASTTPPRRIFSRPSARCSWTTSRPRQTACAAISPPASKHYASSGTGWPPTCLLTRPVGAGTSWWSPTATCDGSKPRSSQRSARVKVRPAWRWTPRWKPRSPSASSTASRSTGGRPKSPRPPCSSSTTKPTANSPQPSDKHPNGCLSRLPPTFTTPTPSRSTGATSSQPLQATRTCSATRPSSGSTPRPPNRPRTCAACGAATTTATWTLSPAGTPKHCTSMPTGVPESSAMSRPTRLPKANPCPHSSPRFNVRGGASSTRTAHSRGTPKRPAKQQCTASSSDSPETADPSNACGPPPTSTLHRPRSPSSKASTPISSTVRTCSSPSARNHSR